MKWKYGKKPACAGKLADDRERLKANDLAASRFVDFVCFVVESERPVLSLINRTYKFTIVPLQ